MMRYVDWCMELEPPWLSICVLLGNALVLGCLLMAGIIAIAAPFEERARLRHDAACAVYGRESISQSVWHGKTSTTYYACRDPKTGQMYAE